MNKKGFTLIELLVAISILSIITLLALPNISRLLQNASKEKFTSYEVVMKNAAKLYVDAYKEDLWGKNEIGCVVLKYDTMLVNELIKEFNVEKIDCATSDTYVVINKHKDNFSYKTSLVCKKDEKIIYSNKTSDDSCDIIPDRTGPVIDISPDGKETWINYDKLKKVTITIKDESYLMANASFKYKWITNRRDVTPDEYTTISITDYKNNEVKEINTEIDVPSTITGNYYLKISPTNVKDMLGNTQSNTFSSKVFKLDNTSPTCTITTSEENSNISLKLTATGIDLDSGMAEDGYSWLSASKGFSATNTKMIYYNSNYKAYVKDNADNVGECNIEIDSLVDRPATPTIINPSNEKWTNQDIVLTVSTTTPADKIGYWYYSYDNVNFARYDNPSYNSYGLSTFNTSPYSQQRDQLAYIRVCNKSATSPNDEINCSDSASTKIRIDKTKPTITYSLINDVTGVNHTAGYWSRNGLYRNLYPKDTGGSGVDHTEYNSGWGWYLEPNLESYWLSHRRETENFRVIDKAGNISDVLTLEIMIDYGPPPAPLISDIEGAIGWSCNSYDAWYNQTRICTVDVYRSVANNFRFNASELDDLSGYRSWMSYYYATGSGCYNNKPSLPWYTWLTDSSGDYGMRNCSNAVYIVKNKDNAGNEGHELQLHITYK